VDRDVGLVIEPRLKLGEEIFPADQWQLLGLGDEKVELAGRFACRGLATALRRPELLASQRESDAGVTKRERDRVPVAGHHHALAHLASGVKRSITHPAASPLFVRR
jgi:hypothetical protein